MKVRAFYTDRNGTDSALAKLPPKETLTVLFGHERNDPTWIMQNRQR